MQPAIRVQQVSKRYEIGAREEYRTLRTAIMDGAAAPFRRFRQRLRARQLDTFPEGPNTFYALDRVGFDVMPGEVVGIVGRNGAGKSTLLKILTRITQPTSGRVELRGRVGSLLEVGTGFHPELTGRENIFLNGAVLGMKRRDITRKFDEIVAFSEVERFLDTPVKRYSSGMYVRLAFAVAAHLESEILLVDEVLAVGDLGFQEKCLGKMDDVARQGRTVLFVSHNLQAVARFTSRTVALEAGRLLIDGPTPQALDSYTRTFRSPSVNAGEFTADPAKPGNHVKWAKVVASDGNGHHRWGHPMTFEFGLEIANPTDALCFSFQVTNTAQIPVCHMWLLDSGMPSRTGTFVLRCEVPRFRLFMGSYALTTWLSDRRSNAMLDHLTNICQFDVNMGSVQRPHYDWRAGDCVYLEDTSWQVEAVEEPCLV